MPSAPVQVYSLHSCFDSILNYVAPNGDLHSLSLAVLGAGPGITLVTQLPDPPPDQLILGPGNKWISPKSLTILDSSFAPQLPDEIQGPIRSYAWQAALKKLIETLAPLFPDNMCGYLKGRASSPAFARLRRGRPSEPQIDTSRNGKTISQAFTNQIRKGLSALQSGHYHDGARFLRGVGPGLTPTGDDILCGFLYALSTGDSIWDTARATIFTNARSTNPISNHFLDAARKGLFFEHIKRFTEMSLRIMQAPGTIAGSRPSQCDLERSCQRVLEHGATSGADTLTGLFHGWHHMAHSTAAGHVGLGSTHL